MPTAILLLRKPTFCATGLFVSATGPILTCAHFVEEDRNADYFAGLDPGNVRNLTRIKLVRASVGQDVALFKAEVEASEHVAIAAELPDSGATVTAHGYAGIAEGRVRIEPVQCTYHGHTAGYSVPAQGPYAAKAYGAVLTSPHLPPGYSGCPIIDSNGEVIALHSASDSDTKLGAVAVSVRNDILRAAVKLV